MVAPGCTPETGIFKAIRKVWKSTERVLHYIGAWSASARRLAGLQTNVFTPQPA